MEFHGFEAKSMELHSLVPSAVRDTILKAVHDNPFAGHLGITHTEERVRKSLYWPAIRVVVEKELREFRVVDVAAQEVGDPSARPARLRQTIRPPDRYMAIETFLYNA
ncbi:Hypothetical predicted protein [Paramuricea clavata]|uniref:Uncharacterized protein n=1 Tax=Paramuricea clavata TaxID=317549 RepID=A0A6S7JKS6_PARCT|nr:Hypothetical predicted protein [Paramuricea clavata]